MNSKALILFQKNAVLGRVKTRIAKTEGDQFALDVYKKLVDFTHLVVRSLDSKKLIFFSDEREELSNELKAFDFDSDVQVGHDLGERMINAFDNALSEGYSKVLLIGTDCGELKKEHLELAFDKLDKSDLVIGPAEDGGYYLIGLKNSNPELFSGISWSTSEVFNQTVQIAENQDIKYSLLPILSDIDTIEDWKKQEAMVQKTLSAVATS